MRNICLFSSTRADWGLLCRLAALIRSSGSLQLSLLVSGTHLSKPHGMTVSDIEAEGFCADARVAFPCDDDSAAGICRAMGSALAGYGEALERLHPDILVLLGDRYETLCVAAAAQILRIPVAHIHGGETTEGAVDEAFRHSITKMAHLHFPCCDEYRRRVIQLGEDPARVFNVGALGIENIREMTFLQREELERSLQFQLDNPFFLATFHPVTLEGRTAGTQVDEFLAALDAFPQHKVILTKANADTGGQIINDRIIAYAAGRPERCLAIDSMGRLRYLSAMGMCDAVVGNSSSGILEAPVLGVPTVNIGDRQKGRVRVASIIDCEPCRDAIGAAIRQALDLSFRRTVRDLKHPCEKIGTAKRIVKMLETVELDGILKKQFYDSGSARKR